MSRLYKKEKRKFYNNLNVNEILDNRTFWKHIKPLFSDKTQHKQKITLVDKNNIIEEDQEVAETFNKFFKNAVNNLDIKENCDLINNVVSIEDPVEKAIAKYSSHPSILRIIEKVKVEKRFEFMQVSLEDLEGQLKKLNPKKATTFKNIPGKLLKENADICGPVLLPIINNNINENTFPDMLKIADVTPVHKKEEVTEVKNYRPVSVLSSTSKVFERLLQVQISAFITKYLSPFLCGYRKGYSAQHALISLLEKWRVTLDNNEYAGAVLMDLSKAFDCMNHDLLIAKLYAYGFRKDAVTMIRNYLTNRWQRTKINTSFSSWSELLTGVPQGSVLGPLLFNIYLNDLFWENELTDVCNFADDTTFYSCDQELDTVLTNLEHDSLIAIEWFEANYMKLNADKCHLIVAGHKHEWVWAKVGNQRIWESRVEKLLGIEIDNKLSFSTHVTTICKKANRKLSALRRYSRLLSFEKRRTLLKAFVESQFAYSPLVWMFHNRSLNNKINRLHERALRMVYNDDISTFNELLTRDGSFTIHERNIQSLAIEMFKVKMNNGPSLLEDIFILTDYNGPCLRSKSEFDIPNINTVHFGEDSLKHFGTLIWDLIPNVVKNADNLEIFKSKIRSWSPGKCPCRLCKQYIEGQGYVELFG